MRLLACCLVIGLSACQPVEKKPESDAPINSQSTQALLEEMNKLASGACSRTSDCLLAGIGERGCGGPEDHLLFSKWDSAPMLFEVLLKYNELRKKEVEGEFSTCEYRMPPAITCLQNKCKELNTTSGTENSLMIIPGALTLYPSNVADGAVYRFKTENNPTSYYLKVLNLDSTSKQRLLQYRKSTTSVKLNVQLWGTLIEAPACNFMIASCTTKVNAYDIRAIKILSIR